MLRAILVDDEDLSVRMLESIVDWLGGQGREQADNEWHDAINWLGDWCSEEQHPVIWSTTQAAEHLPVRMPRLCSAERLSESMVDEIFQKGAA